MPAITAATSPAVYVRRATLRRRGGFKLDLADISIRRGAAVAIVGANGSGKSATFELLLGFRRARRNDIDLLGYPVVYYQTHTDARAMLGAYLPKMAFVGELRVAELVALHRDAYRRQDGRLADALAISELMKLRYSQLARGQRVRLHLFLACAHLPLLLLLDEPTVGLDPVFAKEFLHVIRSEFLGGERTMLLISHRTEEILLADEVIWLAGGRLQARGSFQSLLEQYVGNRRIDVRFHDPSDGWQFERTLRQCDGIRDWRKHPDQSMTVLADSATAPILVDEANKSRLELLSVVPADLSDLLRMERS
jgi:ABC-2 type transport system ATP-binding protein